jgi:ABC-2 type transport system permease protein
MNGFISALWAEALKARRSKITLLTSVGFMILPFAGGLFMVVLKNPEQARAMGLLGAKAQLTAGVADWPTFFAILSQGIAGGGAILFSLITAWVFGREFSDHTAKDLMALPTPRWVIVTAKLVLIAVWIGLLTLLVFAVGLGIGRAVEIPGWSPDLEWLSFRTVLVTSLLTFMLMPFVALFASSGRGYLPPLGWTIFALVLADIISLFGHGDWFPWAIPVLVSGMVTTNADQVGLHSYLVVLLAFFAGVAATLAWWRSADQTR